MTYNVCMYVCKLSLFNKSPIRQKLRGTFLFRGLTCRHKGRVALRMKRKIILFHFHFIIYIAQKSSTIIYSFFIFSNTNKILWTDLRSQLAALMPLVYASRASWQLQEEAPSLLPTMIVANACEGACVRKHACVTY